MLGSPTPQGSWIARGQSLPALVPPPNRTRKTKSLPIAEDDELNIPTIGETGWVQAGKSLPATPSYAQSKIGLRYLQLTKTQRSEIEQYYASEQCKLYLFEDSKEEQESARTKLLDIGLDAESQQALESRWTIQWSTAWNTKRSGCKRTLYQCSCGYSVNSRQERELQTRRAQERDSEGKEWERRVPYPFTGCLAHIEVTEDLNSGAVFKIYGISAHNLDCQTAVLERLPPIPLHEHVYEVALTQLENGASLSAIQDRNQRMMLQKQYRDMSNYNTRTANIRYVFLSSDSPTLYSKFSRKLGIDVRKAPQYNLDDWLNPATASFKPNIQEAIFHYSARAEAGERLEVCISTPEMNKTAWKYAHRSQLVLDGTFGVCSTRMLLFIALAVTAEGKGLPIALFLFSAPSGSKATHAGYNTDILQKLLRLWKTRLDNTARELAIDKAGNDLGPQYFSPFSAITDTDTKERGALLQVWPGIILLICKFHLRQSWGNHRKKAIGQGDLSKPNFWKNHVRDQLRGLEVLLINSVEHTVAEALVQEKRSYFAMIGSGSTEAFQAAKAGNNHLDYLSKNWLPVNMWRSWSEFGRVAAAAAIGIPVSGIIPTTNHLESFNGILKRKHLARWLHSGHRLRFDVLILLLITQILPGVYNRYNIQLQHSQWLSERFRDHAGGQNVVELHRKVVSDKQRQAQAARAICWWAPDQTRDEKANTIVTLQHIMVQPGSDPDHFAATCWSSKTNTVHYNLSMHRSGRAECSCQDFQSQGGACKHLRAMRIYVDSWILRCRAVPFLYPLSLDEARELITDTESETLNTTSSGSSTTVVPTSSSATLVNFSVIQAFGQDRTTLGAEDDAVVEEEDTSSSEGELEEVPSISNEGQWSAVQSQIQGRILHDTAQLLPRLHGLDNLMADLKVSFEPGNATIEELDLVLRGITSRLSELKLQTATQSPISQPHPATSKHTLSSLLNAELAGTSSSVLKPPSRKRLRAPSPEKKQARKNSYSIS